ncbi:MAG TPA: phage holin family protein [Steroidobacteraceae bacterium]|jgi:putative membrane protein|nr:phage holin family protein [Steroidobacteraceae bacterium]
MAGFILRGLIAALGLWAATAMLSGFTIDSATTLILAGLLLGVVNAIVRPFALLLSLPALLFTLGLFLLVINAAMLGLVALMLPGFRIAGFWTAVGGALIVSIVSWIGSWFIGSRGRVEVIRRK